MTIQRHTTRLRITMVLPLLAVASTSLAGNSLVPARQPVSIAKGQMTVLPVQEMNRLGARPGPLVEQWTLDAPQLNHFLLIGGVPVGQSMLRERNKKDRPLPKLSASAGPAELFEFYSGSLTAANPALTLTPVKLEPARVQDCEGVIAEFEDVRQGDDLRRRGRALLCMRGNLMFGVSLTAPDLHYFQRDAGLFDQLIASIGF